MDPLEGLRRVDPGAHKKKGEFAGMQFSRTEIMHILVAVLVLAAAFTIMLRKSYLPFISSYLNTSVLVSILVLFAVARTLAQTTDPDTLAEMTAAPLTGRAVALDGRGGFEVAG